MMKKPYAGRNRKGVSDCEAGNPLPLPEAIRLRLCWPRKLEAKYFKVSERTCLSWAKGTTRPRPAAFSRNLADLLASWPAGLPGLPGSSEDRDRDKEGAFRLLMVMWKASLFCASLGIAAPGHLRLLKRKLEECLSSLALDMPPPEPDTLREGTP